MAPKKATKAKKEEVIEIPKTETVANGVSTHFLGGWSAAQSLQSLEDITKAADSGDRVVVLPGVLKHEAPISCEVRALTLCGARPPAAEPAAAAGGGGEEGDEGDNDAPEEAAATTSSDPVVEQDVVIEGDITLTGWLPPVEVKAPTPPPAEDPKKDTKASKGKGKGKQAKAVEVEEAEAPPPPPPAEVEQPKGANPSAWPTLSVKDICFKGSVSAKGLHLTFENCHFVGGGPHQVQVHQYCSATFTRCTFSSPARSCIYAYPTSKVSARDCTFNGGDLAAEQAGGSGGSCAQSSTGIHADDSEAVVEGCRFQNIAFGVLLHDKCKGASVSKCTFDKIANTACYMERTAALLQGNAVKRCEYYGVSFVGKCTSKVLQNTINSKVRIGKGATPLLHSNNCAVAIEDQNDVGNVFMQPRY